LLLRLAVFLILHKLFFFFAQFFHKQFLLFSDSNFINKLLPVFLVLHGGVVVELLIFCFKIFFTDLAVEISLDFFFLLIISGSCGGCGCSCTTLSGICLPAPLLLFYFNPSLFLVSACLFTILLTLSLLIFNLSSLLSLFLLLALDLLKLHTT
jgi:hypothetical protein